MSSRRKLLLGLCIVAVTAVIAGFILSTTVWNSSEFSPQLDSDSQPFRYPTSGNSSNEQVLPLQTDEYTLQYPESWEVTLQPIAGGGNSTLFTIAGSAANQPEATISIQSTSVEITPKSQIEEIYAALGYKKDPTTIGGESAVKFSGNMGDLYEVAYVVQHNDVVYNFTLSYLSDQTDEVMETHFGSLIGSITFN